MHNISREEDTRCAERLWLTNIKFWTCFSPLVSFRRNERCKSVGDGTLKSAGSEVVMRAVQTLRHGFGLCMKWMLEACETIRGKWEKGPMTQPSLVYTSNLVPSAW